MEKFGTIIIGAGASGLLAALRLGESGCEDVLLLERNDRVGRKLSATGNGQGNITNRSLSQAHYRTSDAALVSSVLHRFGHDALLEYLRSLGGLFFQDEDGRVYPASRQASSVTDLLRFRLGVLKTPVRLGEKTISAAQTKGGFIVRTERNEYFCRYLVLACGGKASPHFGSDGSGYALARAFGHTVTKLRPSLVQWKTELPPIRGLKGVRSECRLTLLRAGAEISQAQGDIIFTDYGISGNAVFQLSPLMREGDAVSVDFLPDITERALLSALENKAERYPSLLAEDLFRCIVNSAVGKCILRCCNVSPNAGIVGGQFPALAHAVKEYRIGLVGGLGFDSAQVTQGGVLATELDENLMSRKADGLFIVGELVDVDGDCGGYNLQWAFSSGWVAASAIVKRQKCVSIT